MSRGWFADQYERDPSCAFRGVDSSVPQPDSAREDGRDGVTSEALRGTIERHRVASTNPVPRPTEAAKPVRLDVPTMVPHSPADRPPIDGA